MKFLIDRCAGSTIARWLQGEGHDVVEARSLGPDPGDNVLLEWAESQGRILITIDTDFGKMIHAEHATHTGLIRLPDVPARMRVQLLELVLKDYGTQIERGSVVTIRGGRIRISKARTE